jgi:hypothetical protein
MNNLEELTEGAYAFASKRLLGTKDPMMTTFVLLKEDQTVDIIGAPWKDDAEKREAIMAIGTAIIGSKEPVLAYSMLSECWTSRYKPDEKQRATRPEFDPQRREAVVCLASTGKEHKFSAWIIERDAQGRCAKLTENTEPGQWSSWMTDALDKAIELAKFKNEVLLNRDRN